MNLHTEAFERGTSIIDSLAPTGPISADEVAASDCKPCSPSGEGGARQADPPVSDQYHSLAYCPRRAHGLASHRARCIAGGTGALGNAGYALPADATEVALPVFGPVLSMVGDAAGRPPDVPLSIAFDNPQLVFGLCHDGVAWSLTTGDGADCRIAGTASDIVLLASGRRAVGEDLSASGPRADAGPALRSYFPMP